MKSTPGPNLKKPVSTGKYWLTYRLPAKITLHLHMYIVLAGVLISFCLAKKFVKQYFLLLKHSFMKLGPVIGNFIGYLLENESILRLLFSFLNALTKLHLIILPLYCHITLLHDFFGPHLTSLA